MNAMTEHVCGCLDCRGVTLPAAPLGEHHFAVRFERERNRGICGNCVVTLDGVDVTDETFECLAGDDGWVASYIRDTDGRRHRCPRCMVGVCADVRHGAVTFRAKTMVG